MNEKPIFILGTHKSGTTLLRNIFNGHSKLYTIPIESHFFQHMNYWIDNEYRYQRPRKSSKQQLYNNFYDFIHKKNITEGKYGGSNPKGLFNENLFKQYFKEVDINSNPKKVLKTYFSAIYYSTNGKELPDNKRIVEKSVENAEFALNLQKYFPKAKFVHIIRNPYSNFVSLRKYKSINFGYPIISRLIKTLYNNYYFLYKNRRLINNYYIIKYKDLVSNPKKYLNKLCNFLNINFETILLNPTYRDQSWSGNSISDKSFDGISADRLGEWKKEIHPMEVTYINHLFPFIINDFQYNFFNKKGSFWKPASGENLKRYLANRFYRFLLQEW